MALSDLTSPTAVKNAINECDLTGRDGFLRRYGFSLAREYVLHYEGAEYDSKAIAGVAHGLQHPQLGVLKSDDFSGGINSVGAGTRLFELGFEIEGKKRGPKDWSLSECEQTVTTYFECLQHKIRGEKFNRDAACQSVASQIGRTKGAVDYKFQNIDAILHEHELPRLNNAIAQNVQRLLRFVVLDPIAQRTTVFSDAPVVVPGTEAPSRPMSPCDMYSRKPAWALPAMWPLPGCCSSFQPENSNDAHIGFLSGKATANKATISASKSYQKHKDVLFEDKAFYQLKNAQSIAVAYDGINPLPPTYCFLKPDFMPRHLTWFQQQAVDFDPRRPA